MFGLTKSTYELLISWTIACLSFLLVYTTLISNSLLRDNSQLRQCRRAMSILRYASVVATITTLPLFYWNIFAVCPVSKPLTSFNSSSGNGQYSFNFSFLRPLTGLITLMVCQVVDNHRFFRFTALFLLFFLICLDCMSSYDVGKEYECLTSTSTRGAGGCVPRPGWEGNNLLLFFYRDLLASGVELFCLLVVCFLGVSLGFLTNRFAYTDLHPKHSHENLLWKELQKHYKPKLR